MTYCISCVLDRMRLSCTPTEGQFELRPEVSLATNHDQLDYPDHRNAQF